MLFTHVADKLSKMPGMSELLSNLQNELEILQQNYLKLSGGKTQCVIGKEGQPSLEIKQAEGAMQAVSDLVRCVKKMAPDKTVNDCIDKVASQWIGLSEISEAWVAYKQAGLDQINKYRQS